VRPRSDRIAGNTFRAGHEGRRCIYDGKPPETDQRIAGPYVNVTSSRYLSGLNEIRRRLAQAAFHPGDAKETGPRGTVVPRISSLGLKPDQQIGRD